MLRLDCAIFLKQNFRDFRAFCLTGWGDCAIVIALTGFLGRFARFLRILLIGFLGPIARFLRED